MNRIIIYSLFILLTIAQVILTGCESHPTNPTTDAFEKVKDEREKTGNGAYIDSLFAAEQAKDTSKAPDNSLPADPLERFIQTAERKVRSNERKIAALKDQPGITIAYFKKLSLTEKNNLQVKIALSEFSEEDPEELEKFREKIMADLEDISTDLEELRQKIRENNPEQ